MAKRIVDEDIKLNIIINGDVAKKELHDLEKSTRSLNESNKQLRTEKARLEKQGKQLGDRYKQVTSEITANNKELKSNKSRMGELQQQIGVTGLTMGQLQSRASQLKLILRNLVPGSADYIKYKAELASVQGRINELSGRATQAKMSLASLADGFNRYAAMGLAFVGMLTGVIFSLQKMIDYNGKLADAQSNVRKTTGMTAKEVDNLTKSFGALQTRTSRMDLLAIAEEGGRIGIVNDEMEDFVGVMNKATVALGDSFTGGVSEVAAKLGKLKFLFKETKDIGVDQAYNSIGSAINELGANGVATEANIAEFATRLGSLPEKLKPSVAAALALGASFEESGVEAEIAARAYNIFLKQAATESAKFAQVMGITQKEVENMINTDPLEFFLHFAEGLNGLDATDVAKTLDFLGVNADGANKALGAVANNSKRFREQIELSNKSFADGTSLINEYDIKNNNLAATLEKIKKTVTGWYSSEALIEWLKDAVNWFGALIGATEDADGSGARWRNGILFTIKILAILIASLLSYNASLRLAALWTNGFTASTTLLNIAVKAQAIGIAFARLGLMIYTSVMGFFGVATDKATAALVRMNMVSKASPWGAALALITAVVVAYAVFAKNTKDAATSQSILNNTMREADALVKKETTSLQNLLSVAKDKNVSDEVRQAAIKKLNEQYPEYLANLSLENINTAEGQKLIDQYIKSLHKKAELQILEKRQAALLEQISERKNQSLEEEINLLDEAWAYMKNFGNVGRAGADAMVTASKRKTEALRELQNELKLTDEEMKKHLVANPNLINEVGDDPKSTYVVPGGSATGGDKSGKKAADERKRRLELLEKYKAELLALERKAIDDQLALMAEGYDKEMALEKENHRRKIEDLKLQMKSENDLSNLDKDIAKAKKSGDTGLTGELIAQKEHWVKVNAHLNKQVEHEATMHGMRVSTIQDRAATTLLKKEEEKYNREKVLRDTAFNEELAALGDNAVAREALQKEYAAAERKSEEEFLLTKIEELKRIVAGESINGIDFELLTDEQKEEMLKSIEYAKLKISELKAAVSGEDKPAGLEAAFGKTDILGFSGEDWDLFFSNLSKGTIGINEMMFAVSALTDMYSQYSEFLTANENASLKRFEQGSEAKKRSLKRQLDDGRMNQVQYKRAIEQVDMDLDKKKAEIEYRQAKRQKMIAVANIIQSTAQAIIGIWAQFPKFDFGATAGIMSGIVGSLGALQLATALKTPLPAKGFEDGLYPDSIKREQDGKVFKSRYLGKTRSGLVSKSGYFAVTENNRPEMVIDNKAWTKMNPELKDSLLRELRGIKGFEQGYYNNKLATPRVEVPATSATSSDSTLLKMALAVMEQNTMATRELNQILSQPIGAVVSSKDARSMDELRKGVKEAEKRRNLNKV